MSDHEDNTTVAEPIINGYAVGTAMLDQASASKPDARQGAYDVFDCLDSKEFVKSPEVQALQGVTPPVKVVVAGEPGAGKTCLLRTILVLLGHQDAATLVVGSLDGRCSDIVCYVAVY
jgi:hypothetical protein